MSNMEECVLMCELQGSWNAHDVEERREKKEKGGFRLGWVSVNK